MALQTETHEPEAGAVPPSPGPSPWFVGHRRAWIGGLIALALAGYLLTGIFTVAADEQAVIRRFGRVAFGNKEGRMAGRSGLLGANPIPSIGHFEQIGKLADGLGIHIELQKQEWKVYLNSLRRLDYDLARSSWVGDYNDPNTFIDCFLGAGGNNRTGWKNPRYDTLLREACAQLDRKKREKTLQQAEILLVRDEAPIVPLYYYAGLEYHDESKIKGIFPNALDVHPIQGIYKVNPGSVVRSQWPVVRSELPSATLTTDP